MQRALLVPFLALALSAAPPLVEPAQADTVSFGGKIKNIRIRERNNSQGYRVTATVTDGETVAENTRPKRIDVGWDVYGLSTPITTTLDEVARARQGHASDGLIFEPGSPDAVMNGTVALFSGGAVVGVASLSVPYDAGADTTLSEDEWQMAGAGVEVTLSSGVTVRVGASVRDLASGGQRAVVRVVGDDELAAAAVDTVELQFEEPFEGPAPLENPISMPRTSGQTTFRLKTTPAALTDLIDASGGNVTLDATVHNSSGDLLLLQPAAPVALTTDGTPTVWSPELSDAWVPAVPADGGSAAAAADANMLTHLDGFDWSDAALFDADGAGVPGGSSATRTFQDVRVGDTVVKVDRLTDGSGPLPAVETQRVMNLREYNTNDVLYVGIGDCSCGGSVLAWPVGAGQEVQVDVTDSGDADGTRTFSLALDGVVMDSVASTPGGATTGNFALTDSDGTGILGVEVEFADGTLGGACVYRGFEGSPNFQVTGGPKTIRTSGSCMSWGD